MKRLAQHTNALSRDCRGATAPEFAVVATVFLTFIMGICYLGLMLFTYAGVHWAVEDASRVAALNTSATSSDLQTAINNDLTSIGLPNATSVTYTVVTTPFQVATVGATLTQSYVVPLLSTVTITYSATTQVPQGF
ncbi:MAG TPA: TadE/TadG family type IV pilus assembly protein [Micropepsaceae bacterium]|nr:TadE/TadG family type IV pilus assembly protein [Micropepsaceae bacterium]